MDRQNIVICGAGIAGISTAYHLAVRQGMRDILLIDERPPLSLTSDKSTECYRNWWPGPGDAMVSLMNRSIDLLEHLACASGNAFHLNRRGYLYLTADKDKLHHMLEQAQESSKLGAGPLRIYRGESDDQRYHPHDPLDYSTAPEGADLILDRNLLRRHFPYLSGQAVAGLHVRRAGWFSAQQLGSLLLSLAKENGVNLLEGRVTGVDLERGQVVGVRLESGEVIPTHHFVDAGGPFLGLVAETFGIQLPIFNELHLKVSANDHLNIIPRDAPLLIWNDPQTLPWTNEERQFLAEDASSRHLLEEFPAGVHTRPEGPPDSHIILMLWEYHTSQVEPSWPLQLDPEYPEIALRGLATMIPELKKYFDKPPRPYLDGGYYTKTRENRPLIGPLPIEGAWVIGALSGFGLMASMAAGELLALHIMKKQLPLYAPAFDLNRYQNPDYQNLLEQWEDSGQL